MRDSSTTIDFSFSFRYLRGGQYDEANAITVCEPNYDKRGVHRRMSSAVMDALSVALSKESEAGRAPKPTAPANGETQDPMLLAYEVIVAFLRAGMPTEEYVRFCDYVQKELTNCKALAYVGAEGDDRIPVTEEVWMNLAREGGVEAIDRVIAEFARFFSPFAPSPKSSGIEKSSSSEAKPAASSRTKKP